jgi:undecaprenyl-diphosphatase
MPLLIEIVEDVAKLAFSVAALYLALRLYLRHRRPDWHDRVDRRRAAFVWLLSLGAVAVMVAERALGGDSHLIDRRVLLWIREHLPAAWTPPFEWVTLTASGTVLTPLTVAATAALALARRRAEALLIAGSVCCGASVVFLMKITIGRERPALWEAQWYWGSSFPSGHTLSMAAFATAAALVAGRLWPPTRVPALLAALVWVLLVGFSRLVLGVHWPTDVVVAACLGAAIPLGFSFSLEHRRA